MGRKLDFAIKVQELCTAVINAHVDGYDMRDVYNDEGYFPAGGDAIVDGDVSSLEVIATDIEHCMQFFENFQKMLDNQQVTTADYRSYLNKVRLIE